MSPFTTILAPISFCLLPFLLPPTTIATPAPVPAPVNGDPCGPQIQDNPNYPNTCSVAPALVQSPQPYGINCTAIYTVSGPQSIALENCAASYESACRKALDPRTRTNTWIWTMLAEQCALGFFLPPYQGSAQLLNGTRCIEIFTAMANTCSTSVPPSNYGSVNLRTLPGLPPTTTIDGQPAYDGYPSNDMFFTGNAVNVGYPSYAISYVPSSPFF